jgi:hypothetical protein
MDYDNRASYHYPTMSATAQTGFMIDYPKQPVYGAWTYVEVNTLRSDMPLDRFRPATPFHGALRCLMKTVSTGSIQYTSPVSVATPTKKPTLHNYSRTSTYTKQEVPSSVDGRNIKERDLIVAVF